MKVFNMKDLSNELREQLLEYRENYDSYRGYRTEQGGGEGIILGICVFTIAVFFLFSATSSYKTMLLWEIGLNFFFALMLAAGVVFPIREIIRHKHTEIKPFTFINPRMFVSVNYETVTFINLFHDMKSCKGVQNYLNNSYTGTDFNIETHEGYQYSFRFSRHEDYEYFCDLLAQDDVGYFQHLYDEYEQNKRPSQEIPELAFMYKMGTGYFDTDPETKKFGITKPVAWILTVVVALGTTGTCYFLDQQHYNRVMGKRKKYRNQRYNQRRNYRNNRYQRDKHQRRYRRPDPYQGQPARGQQPQYQQQDHFGPGPQRNNSQQKKQQPSNNQRRQHDDQHNHPNQYQ